MACCLSKRDLHARSGKTQGQKYAFSARNALEALEIIDKFRIANRFVQLESNISIVNMKKLKCKHWPIRGCGSKYLVRLANHLTQVHELTELKRKYWLQFAKLQNTNAIRVYDKETEPKTIFSINLRAFTRIRRKHDWRCPRKYHLVLWYLPACLRRDTKTFSQHYVRGRSS